MERNDVDVTMSRVPFHMVTARTTATGERYYRELYTYAVRRAEDEITRKRERERERERKSDGYGRRRVLGSGAPLRINSNLFLFEIQQCDRRIITVERIAGAAVCCLLATSGLIHSATHQMQIQLLESIHFG